MLDSLKKLNIKRYNGLGKRVGNKVWFLLDAVGFFSDPEIVRNVLSIEHGLCPYTTVVRVELSSNKIVFIESPTFNTDNEPVVGRSHHYEDGKLVKVVNPPKDPLVYHHKWLFVPDCYDRFSVVASMERSLKWKSKLGTNSEVSSRIGRKSFWRSWVKKEGIGE